MQQQTIIRSPVGPMAWEFRAGFQENPYPDFRNFSVPYPKLPEIRLALPLPIPINDEACRLSRYGCLQTFSNRNPTYGSGLPGF